MSKQTTYEFKVKMTCGGCGKSVKKALDNLKGVVDSEIDLPNQKVRVRSTLPNEQRILDVLRSTGKTVDFIRRIDD